MKLKYQLLLLALMSIVFPITGWLALKSVDKEFRLGMEQAAQSTLTSLQASLSQIINNNSSISLKGFVVEGLAHLSVDGDDSEWQGIQAYNFKDKTFQLSIKMAQFQNKLVLLIRTNDQSKDNFYTPQVVNDKIIIALADSAALYKLTFNREAEGVVTAVDVAQNLPRYQAYWHEMTGGYQLEIAFDSFQFHHLGIASINGLPQHKVTVGTLQEDGNNRIRLLPIVSQDKNLQSIINRITPMNNQLTILDDSRRIIAQSNKLPKNQQVSSWQWVITPLYQWLFVVKNNDKWFYRTKDGMAGIQISQKHEGIIYELKSMMPQGQQSMIQSLLKAGVVMLLVVFIIVVIYLLYALVLAWRIRQLNFSLQKVLDNSGQFHTIMPSNKAQDELGQLSRGIQ
ncbi:MAG TPA: hypothetical protein ENJ44_04750, partial [Oceanospirillales bacterium]|nr:hypothetical protein [Oceanospirillales bacterium]